GQSIAVSLPVPTAPTTFDYTSIFTQNANVTICPDGAQACAGGPAVDADDVITGGTARNIVVGGQANDTIYGGPSADDVIGGHNVAAGQDANDTIDGGAGNDVIAGDNASVLPNGLTTSPLVRALTQATIYTVVRGSDGSITFQPNVGAPAVAPTRAMQRTITLFDGGTSDATLYGSDYIAGGANNDLIFGEMGADVIQGDGSVNPALTGGVRVGASIDSIGTL